VGCWDERMKSFWEKKNYVGQKLRVANRSVETRRCEKERKT
jgi:hypothetical protein